MPYVIEVPFGYVETGRLDTPTLEDAKHFPTMKRAKAFAQQNCSGSQYKFIEVTEDNIIIGEVRRDGSRE